MQGGWRPQRHELAVAQELGDGSAIVLDPAGRIAYALTSSAWEVWLGCDGETPVCALVDRLEAIFAAPRALIEQDVERLLDELAAKGLLHTVAADPDLRQTA